MATAQQMRDIKYRKHFWHLFYAVKLGCLFTQERNHLSLVDGCQIVARIVAQYSPVLMPLYTRWQ